VLLLERSIGDDVRLEVSLREHVPHIWADPGQIQQVLLNLAVNARDAMPRGGQLRVETSSVTITGSAETAIGSQMLPGVYAMLVVQDNGSGIPPEVVPSIFEPFFTTKPTGVGTGLGLSTVYGIVNQTSGHIRVQSEPDRGTTFKLYFPEYAAEPDDAPKASPAVPTQSHPLEGATILVVEDESMVRDAIRRMLLRAKFRVVETSNAADALELLSKSDVSVDLLITDMVMPGVSGAELATAVSIKYPRLPIILMSGYSEAASRGEWRLPDGVVFVEKPISPAPFIQIVRRALTGT
jgi:two-component system, cell cycle sensor histidine kinase and response regulator CckA